MFGDVPDNDELDGFTDLEVFAKTIYGEARGEPYEGQQAIANVVMNRVNHGGWWGSDVREVCLKPYQFSCWNIGDPNRTTIMAVTEENAIYVGCIAIATDASNRHLNDDTNGADSYYAKSMPKPPRWAENLVPCAQIGNHLFFQIVDYN